MATGKAVNDLFERGRLPFNSALRAFQRVNWTIEMSVNQSASPPARAAASNTHTSFLLISRVNGLHAHGHSLVATGASPQETCL